MKYLFSLFVIVLLGSCSTSKSNENVVVKTANVEVKPAAVIQRDTTPPKKTNSRIRYAVDNSRPKDKIKQDFPFDIPMTNSKREKINSELVLKKNGKPTIVLFWLTTCYPCRMELNAIKKKYPQWKKEADFNFVVISTDFQKNYEKFITRVAKEDWAWETYHDTNREFKKVIPGKLNGLPQTFIYDTNGEIVYHKRKYQSGDEDKLFEEVKKYTK